MKNNSHKILLVEDEPVTHHAICKIFQKNNYNYKGVTLLSEAVREIKQEKYDIIFSDVRLPDGSGLDLLDLVQDYLLDVPIVVITASDNKELVQHSLQKGASDFLSKPFNLQNIPTIIDRNIQRKKIEYAKNNPRKASVLLKAIKALISALEAKDRDTSGHSLRVAHFAKIIGDQVGITDDEQFILQLSAVLHDIGKIGLPDNILKKETSLLDTEYVTAKEHPLIGSKIVGNIDELHEVAAIIRHHHERYDGKGYPDGLQGEAIPLLARILTIADAYEAITSRRIYSGSQSPQKAIEEIKKNAGAQFDPKLVKVFLKVVEENEFYNVQRHYF